MIYYKCFHFFLLFASSLLGDSFVYQCKINVYNNRRLKNNVLYTSSDDNDKFIKDIYKKYESYIVEDDNLKNYTILNETLLNNQLKELEILESKDMKRVDLRRNNKRFYKTKISKIDNLLYNFTLELLQNMKDDINENIFDDKYDISSSYNSNNMNNRVNKKSSNFEVISDYNCRFKDIGGYKIVKQELYQITDILKNYKKYMRFNVRVPKGLIFDGPPGTGKTLFAKSFAGECKCNFISVGGADFHEKYVGVGSARVKELFSLARQNIPCIIFIDEIDALTRKRSVDTDQSSVERDSTLNALLIELDGFKNNTGVFLIGATNRIDLIDKALLRPGRIDKKIYLGYPDDETRKEILNIHLKGKPLSSSVNIDDLVDVTEGLTGAEIESMINEAMLSCLRKNKEELNMDELDAVINKMISGWQPNEYSYSDNMIDRICVHEMGHAILGILSKYDTGIRKVVLNLNSPNMPGFTLLKKSIGNIALKDFLIDRLIILMGGRVAEEIIYSNSITTGAINDFEEVLKLSEKMILYYGMGDEIIYPRISDKYKQIIDENINELIKHAHDCAYDKLCKAKDLIIIGANMLKKNKVIKEHELKELITSDFPDLLNT